MTTPPMPPIANRVCKHCKSTDTFVPMLHKIRSHKSLMTMAKDKRQNFHCGNCGFVTYPNIHNSMPEEVSEELPRYGFPEDIE